ncbi:MAG: MBL fold metallo-hydrolase [Salinirussus sp.]
MKPVPVDVGDAADIYAVDVEMFGVERYGAVFVVDADRPAVIDTGTGANVEGLIDALGSLGIAPEDLQIIAPTHVHLDHAGGAGYLARECPNADLYVHERGARHLIDPERLWEGTKRAVPDWVDHYAEPLPVPQKRVVEISEGDSIDLGSRKLAVIDAPGHAPHQAVFDDPESDCIFVADAAGLYVEEFARPRPTTPPPNFDLSQCQADIERLRELDRSGFLFPHCGAAPAAELLNGYAAELDLWVETVEAAIDDAGTDDVAGIVDELDVWSDAAAVWGEQHVRETQALNVRGVLARSD